MALPQLNDKQEHDVKCAVDDVFGFLKKNMSKGEYPLPNLIEHIGYPEGHSLYQTIHLRVKMEMVSRKDIEWKRDKNNGKQTLFLWCTSRNGSSNRGSVHISNKKGDEMVNGKIEADGRRLKLHERILDYLQEHTGNEFTLNHVVRTLGRHV